MAAGRARILGETSSHVELLVLNPGDGNNGDDDERDGDPT